MCSCSNNFTNTNSALSILESNEFTSDINNQDIPDLLDPSNVGVNEKQFYNEKLYSSSNLSNVITIDATNFNVNGHDKKDDTLAFINLIEEARKYMSSDNYVKIVLPEGQLDFIGQVNSIDKNYALVLKNLNNLIISGNNTEIYLHGETKGFLIENCQNVYIENISLDYGVPPFSTGKIIENDGKKFKVKVNEGYVIDENTRVSAFLEYNKTSFTPRSRGNDIYGDVLKTTYLGNNTLEIEFKSHYKVAPKDTLVVLRHYLYEYDMFFINKCENVYFESINIYSAAGMGARAYSSENLYFNRFNCMLKKKTDRLMSVTADGIHAIDCYGELSITNSMFENLGDDAANIHSMYFEVKEIISENKIYMLNPRGYNFEPNVGDVLEINSSFDLTELFKSKVKSIVKRTPGYEIEFEDNISSLVELGNVVGNATRIPKFIFKNNIVRNKRCRGILVQTRNVEIANNTFANLGDAGVLLTGDANEWYEAILSRDVIIKNNKFLKNNYLAGNNGGDICITAFGKGYNPASTGSIKNVEIFNNFMANSANCGIYASGISNLNIHHNLISNVGLLPKSARLNAGIYLTYCEDVKLSHNLVYKNSSADFKGLNIGAFANIDKITLNKNNGFTIDDIVDTSVNTRFIIPKITNSSELKIEGSDLSNWKDIPQNINIIGISDVDQVELSFDDSTFKINEIYMAYDDNGIYIAYDIFDEELLYSNSNSFWEGDGVEIFIAADTESKDPLSVLKITDKSCLELFMSPNTLYGNKVVELRSSQEIFEKAQLIQMSFVEKDSNDGYVGKTYIPFEVIPTIKNKILNDEDFAFAINFIDSDTGKLRVQYSNVSHPVEFNKYTPYKMAKVSRDGGNNG